MSVKSDMGSSISIGILLSAVKASLPFMTVLANPLMFCHLQTKADENEVSPKDTNQVEQVSHKNRADSGIANPGWKARLKRNH